MLVEEQQHTLDIHGRVSPAPRGHADGKYARELQLVTWRGSDGLCELDRLKKDFPRDASCFCARSLDSWRRKSKHLEWLDSAVFPTAETADRDFVYVLLWYLEASKSVGTGTLGVSQPRCATELKK